MSSRRRADRRAHADPPNRVPRNLEGAAFYEIEEYHVASWNPLPDGKGPSTQVHMMLKMRSIPYPFLIRFKTPEAVDRMIDALERHRYDVWPGGPTPESEVS